MATVEFPIDASADELVPVSNLFAAGDRASTSAPSDELSDVLRWHGAWAGVIAASLIGLAALGHGLGWAPALALLAGAAPGPAALLLRRRDGPRPRAALLGFWAGCCAAAAMLTGGVSGPLAVWCLAPAAAAAVFGASSLLAEAGALALASAAITALAGLAGLLPPAPPAPVGFWLGLIGLLTTGLGLGSGLLLSRRRAGQREQLRRAAEAEIERLLSEQPHLVLALDPDGTVLAAFGYAPVGIDTAGLRGQRLPDLAAPSDYAAAARALSGALIMGSGDCLFAPAGRLSAAAPSPYGEPPTAGWRPSCATRRRKPRAKPICRPPETMPRP